MSKYLTLPFLVAFLLGVFLSTMVKSTFAHIKSQAGG